jgi:hypothetical protein
MFWPGAAGLEARKGKAKGKGQKTRQKAKGKNQK